MRLPILASLVALLATNALTAQFSFDPRVDYGAATRPGGSAAFDLDGDGDLDLAVAVDTPDRLLIFLNQGNGTFVNGGSFTLPNSSSPGAVVSGDFTGDGLEDLAVALQDFSQVLLVTNTGGGLANGGTTAVGLNSRGLDAADMDGDGDLDMVIANRDSNTATVMVNGGTGTFSTITLAAGLEPRGAAFGDFDGDGDQDVVVSNHDSRNLYVFTNGGGGFAFTLTATLTFAGVRPEGVATGDFNADGFDDIVAAVNDPNFASFFYSTGAGWGGANNVATGGIDTSTVLAADLDCDGDLDVVTGNETSSNLTLLANNGGVFTATGILTAGINPEQAGAADLDGDGDLELFHGNRDSNTLSVHGNATCSGGPTLAITGTCPGPVTATVTGATAGGRIAFAAAGGTGSFVVPNGLPCAGTVLGLNSTVRLMATVTADAAGSASVSGNLPAFACGRAFAQVIDLATCTTSNVVGL